MSYVYLTIEQAIATHGKTVEVSGGGLLGVIDIGPLESVLEHIQNDSYYPTLEDKVTHLFFGACKFHCFQDGNKRLATVLCTQMLLLNGYLYCASNFIAAMENIAIHVAADRISKILLGEIIAAHIARDDSNEALKLKILEAISQE